MLQQFGDKLKTTLFDFNGEKRILWRDSSLWGPSSWGSQGLHGRWLLIVQEDSNFSTYPSVPDMFQVRKIEMLLAKEEGKDTAFMERGSWASVQAGGRPAELIGRR